MPFAAGWLAPHASVTPADDLLLELRRHEDADEVALIRRALDAAQAGYAWARAALDASTDEVTLHAGMLGAATAHAGETLREFGNDFLIGTLGSEPRRRRARAGEIAILDATVTLRGYRADMCRPFAVDRRPSTVQVNVRRRIVDAFDRIERTIAPGARCRELDRDIRGMLHGHHGWTFEHHLGHGIGLDAHEAPRINPHWDDTFQVGDLVAVEPGRYGGDFYAGLRIEQVLLCVRDRARAIDVFSNGSDMRAVESAIPKARESSSATVHRVWRGRSRTTR